MRDNKKTARRPPGTAGRSAAKKDRPKAGTFERSRPGLAPRTSMQLLYQNSVKMQAPIRTGKEVFPVTGWEVVLTVIGTGWLTGRLFRLIDWIERS